MHLFWLIEKYESSSCVLNGAYEWKSSELHDDFMCHNLVVIAAAAAALVYDAL